MKTQNCINTIAMREPIKWTEINDILNRVPVTVSASLVSVFDDLCQWQRRAEMRQRLVHMDDHMLGDIGMSRATALDEAGKPFWHK